MNALTVAASVALATMYATIGVLVVGENLRFRTTRGVSWFGVSVAAVMFTCAPHHLVHAIELLDGRDHPVAVSAASIAALGPAAVFAGLRLEAACRRGGDRRMVLHPVLVVAIPLAYVGAMFVAVGSELASRPSADGGHAGHAAAAAGAHTSPTAYLPTVVLVVGYLTVGAMVLAWQVRDFRRSSSWSLSGVALGAVFPTCAFAHLLHVLHTPPTSMLQAVDVTAAVAATAMIVVVRRLWTAQITDWTDGASRARTPARQSPWSTPA